MKTFLKGLGKAAIGVLTTGAGILIALVGANFAKDNVDGMAQSMKKTESEAKTETEPEEENDED